MSDRGQTEEASTGLVDPRTIHPGPEPAGPDPSPGSEVREAPDVDTPAWEGPGPGGSDPGLVDPRSEIPGP